MSPLPRWLSSRPPAAALEISARRVTLAVVADHGGSRVLSAYAHEALPEGAVEPALNSPNVHDAAALSAAIRSALDRVTPRPAQTLQHLIQRSDDGGAIEDVVRGE